MYTFRIRLANDDVVTVHCDNNEIHNVLRNIIPKNSKVVVYQDGIQLNNDIMGTAYEQVVEKLFDICEEREQQLEGQLPAGAGNE